MLRYQSTVERIPSASPIVGSHPSARIREVFSSLRGVPSARLVSLSRARQPEPLGLVHQRRKREKVAFTGNLNQRKAARSQLVYLVTKPNNLPK